MEKNSEEIQLGDLELFAHKFGQKQLSIVLSTLGRGTIFTQAMESEIGSEILKDAVSRLTELTVRINEDPFCDEKIRMEKVILSRICHQWAARIIQFNKAKKLLKP